LRLGAIGAVDHGAEGVVLGAVLRIPAQVLAGDAQASGFAIERVQVFKMADRNYVLSQGRIIAQGAAKSLMADETLRAGYLGL